MRHFFQISKLPPLFAKQVRVSFGAENELDLSRINMEWLWVKVKARLEEVVEGRRGIGSGVFCWCWSWLNPVRIELSWMMTLDVGCDYGSRK